MEVDAFQHYEFFTNSIRFKDHLIFFEETLIISTKIYFRRTLPPPQFSMGQARI